MAAGVGGGGQRAPQLCQQRPVILQVFVRVKPAGRWAQGAPSCLPTLMQTRRAAVSKCSVALSDSAPLAGPYRAARALEACLTRQVRCCALQVAEVARLLSSDQASVVEGPAAVRVRGEEVSLGRPALLQQWHY